MNLPFSSRSSADFVTKYFWFTANEQKRESGWNDIGSGEWIKNQTAVVGPQKSPTEETGIILFGCRRIAFARCIRNLSYLHHIYKFETSLSLESPTRNGKLLMRKSKLPIWTVLTKHSEEVCERSRMSHCTRYSAIRWSFLSMLVYHVRGTLNIYQSCTVQHPVPIEMPHNDNGRVIV